MGMARDIMKDLSHRTAKEIARLLHSRAVQEFDAGAVPEHLHHQLMLAAGAAGGVGQRRLGITGIFDEFGKGLHRHLRIDRERAKRT